MKMSIDIGTPFCYERGGKVQMSQNVYVKFENYTIDGGYLNHNHGKAGESDLWTFEPDDDLRGALICHTANIQVDPVPDNKGRSELGRGSQNDVMKKRIRNLIRGLIAEASSPV